MKSRSHRLPVSETHQDDWVDGSWTVDCICGVNYDDGEEMVDCDECGVWVHTRCSRYVKSEKSFACDKCKSKTSGGAGWGATNDSEEAEVAEFLVELPTKTLRMDNPISAGMASRRAFRLWTDIPMEERVHVQGVPDGEPGLFLWSGMSSIFGPELWKSTGYVPKKFNSRYTEFPCLDSGKVEEKKKKEMDRLGGDDNTNQADSGAGVLFSLLKENDNTLPSRVVDFVGVKSPVEGNWRHEVVSLRRKRNLGGENMDFSCREDSMKNETDSVCIRLHTGKRKEEVGMLKDQTENKKVKTMEEDGDAKTRAANGSIAASTTSNDAKHLESSQDRGSNDVSIQCGQYVLHDQQDGLGECATNLASNEHGLEATHRNGVSSDELSKGRSREDYVPVRFENISETNNDVVSVTEPNVSLRQPVKEEIPRDFLQTGGDAGGGAGNDGRVAVDAKISNPYPKETGHGKSSVTDETNSRTNKKVKGELDADGLRHHHVQPLPLNGDKLETVKVSSQYPDSSVNVFSDKGEVIETSIRSSEASNPKVLDVTRSSTSRTCNSDESPGNHSQYKRQPTGEVSAGARKKSSGPKYNSEVADESYKSDDTARRSYSTASYQRKAVCLVKLTSTLGGVISKIPDNHTTATIQNASFHSKQNGLSGSTVATVKNNTLTDMVDHEEKCGRLKKLVKQHSRHLSTIPESTKLPHTTDSKEPSSDFKGSSIHSSSKVQLVPNVAFDRVSGECTGPRIESASNVQNKAAALAEPGKAEKLSQPSSHPSSRGNASSMTTPTPANVPATLSDEELALLLHHELNSSPRVPRVPRMRHTVSLPQFAGSGATSVLMKRTSSGGVKEHSVASTSRRRTKDFSGKGSHDFMELDNEDKKMERKPSSSDNRRRDSGYNADLLSRRATDGGCAIGLQSMKKTNVGTYLSSSADASGNNLSSSRPSSKTASDDDPRVVDRLTTCTLPGLIAEIMSEGKRMTYEALCNTVLPHWPHLRKHNGERYAYTSHSQAVLDCLRNRSEWARLVDRGPKTGTSRKQCKHDADTLSIESEDNEENRVKNAKDSGSKSSEVHREDFAKGKRGDRKCRHLAMQGREIVRRRRAEIVGDDESESLSSSCEENSASSEEEVQGGGASVGGSEASASSDEV